MSFRSFLIRYIKILTDVFLPIIGIFYYSTILAAVIFETDQWLVAIGKGFFFSIPLLTIWLYFHRFTLVKIIYISNGVLSLILYYSYYSSGSNTTVPVNAYVKSSWPSIFSDNFLHKVLFNIHESVFIWAPYFLFFICLHYGIKRRCPKCDPIYGIYSRKLIKSVFLRTESFISYQTTTKESPLYGGYSRHGGTLIERETKPVTNYYDVYELFYKCKVCKHQWSCIKSYYMRSSKF